MTNKITKTFCPICNSSTGLARNGQLDKRQPVPEIIWGRVRRDGGFDQRYASKIETAEVGALDLFLNCTECSARWIFREFRYSEYQPVVMGVLLAGRKCSQCSHEHLLLVEPQTAECVLCAKRESLIPVAADLSTWSAEDAELAALEERIAELKAKRYASLRSEALRRKGEALWTPEETEWMRHRNS